MNDRSEKLSRLEEQFYEVERIVNYLNIRPKAYDMDELYYSNELHTLKMIKDNEGINQNELAEKTYRMKGATSVMVNKLEEKGLIEKKKDKTDRRHSRLYLTKKGEEVNENHIKYDRQVFEKWVEDMPVTEEQLDTTIYVLGEWIKYFRGKLYKSYND